MTDLHHVYLFHNDIMTMMWCSFSICQNKLHFQLRSCCLGWLLQLQWWMYIGGRPFNGLYDCHEYKQLNNRKTWIPLPNPLSQFYYWTCCDSVLSSWTMAYWAIARSYSIWNKIHIHHTIFWCVINYFLCWCNNLYKDHCLDNINNISLVN